MLRTSTLDYVWWNVTITETSPFCLLAIKSTEPLICLHWLWSSIKWCIFFPFNNKSKLSIALSLRKLSSTLIYTAIVKRDQLGDDFTMTSPAKLSKRIIRILFYRITFICIHQKSLCARWQHNDTPAVATWIRQDCRHYYRHAPAFLATVNDILAHSPTTPPPTPSRQKLETNITTSRTV